LPTATIIPSPTVLPTITPTPTPSYSCSLQSVTSGGVTVSCYKRAVSGGGTTTTTPAAL
jgi:hypothetical protein